MVSRPRERETNDQRKEHMNERARFRHGSPDGYKVLLELDNYINNCGLELPLLYLIYLRISQINGCAYCTDMHWKDARHAGASENKLTLVPCWREAPGFTERERAALSWAETVTNLADGHVSDAEYASACAAFSEAEICNLTLAISAINLWNRLGISFRMEPGNYQPS